MASDGAKGQDWLKTYVRINRAHPELLDELTAIAPNQRAERIRSLAQIGLACLRGYGPGWDHEADAGDPSSPKGESSTHGTSGEVDPERARSVIAGLDENLV